MTPIRNAVATIEKPLRITDLRVALVIVPSSGLLSIGPQLARRLGRETLCWIPSGVKSKRLPKNARIS